MADQILSKDQQRRFGYQSISIDKNQPLGRGAYGAVYKVKCDQLGSCQQHGGR